MLSKSSRSIGGGEDPDLPGAYSDREEEREKVEPAIDAESSN